MSTWIAIWWQATTAAVLVAIAATATFATLYPYRNRPLPEWPYHITIGALLSAYSVTLRTASTFLIAEGLSQLKWLWYNDTSRPLYDLALYDTASNGPFEALALLWRLHFAPRTWQWLGCILILLMLLADPFTQQVLQYVPCQVLDSSTEQATVPRISVFMGFEAGPGINLSAHTAGEGLPTPEQSPVNAGLFHPDLISDTCQTGNCTIPPYSSIGYCAECARRFFASPNYHHEMRSEQ